jgi:hypothetical protein
VTASRTRGRAVVIVAALVATAGFSALFAYLDTRPSPPRIVLYGDSLSMQSAQDFQFFADAEGAPVLLRAYSGTAICDALPRIPSDATSWQPNVAVLQFSGNALTNCMKGYEAGTPAYFTKYRHDAQAAIDALRSHGVRVLLIGSPISSWTALSENATRVNAMYADLAKANRGVAYVDAGQSVLSDGKFTWTLPCLAIEPCTGKAGTNVVRSPDGVHFCPSGRTTTEGRYDVCDVYSSGALRFALAMLGPALGSESRRPTSAAAPVRPEAPVRPGPLRPGAPAARA